LFFLDESRFDRDFCRGSLTRSLSPSRASVIAGFIIW
jgi:hypothetical protein